MTETLELFARDGAYYKRGNVTNVRRTKDELRWTNSRGEKDQMALCFLEWYRHTVELGDN